MNRGRTSEAMEAFRRLREQSRRIGHRSGESLAWTNLGSLFLKLGRYEEARETLEQVVRIAPEIQARDHEASAQGDLGWLDGTRGDLERGNDALEAADSLRIEYGLTWFHGTLLLHRGSVEELYGHTEAAETFLKEALRICAESDDPVGRSTAHLYLGRIARNDGGGLQQLFHFREARRIGDEVNAVPESLSASIELALLREVDLAEALARFEESGERLSFAERMRAQYALFQAGGGPSHLLEADRMLSETLAGLSDGARQRAIDSIPLYRKIRAARIA
jgi:tetratricopeptide (TPR) repeat protein